MSGYINGLGGSCCADCMPAACDSCAPSYSVTYRSRSASKTKCGHAEFGTPSSPPKFYLTKTLSGLITETQYADTPDCEAACIFTAEWAWSGSCVYSRPGCGAPSNTLAFNYGYDTNADCVVDSFDFEVTPDCDITAVPSNPGPPDGESITINPDQFILNRDGVCRAGQKMVGTATLSLSDEYTTAQLIDDVDDALALATWSGFGGSSITAFWDLSSDEKTCSKREVQFRVTFASPTSGALKVEWDVYENGVFSYHSCADIPSGTTDWDSPELAAVADDDDLEFDNVTVVSGAC